VTHLRASEGWSVQTIELWEARHLIGLWHYSKSSPNTATYRHGLIGPDWAHYGAAVWIPPTRAAAEKVAGTDWEGVLCLSRLVVAPEVPTNGASFLLGRSMRLIDRDRWPVLLTYADTRLGHTGAIYKATNWESHGPVPAGDVWVHSVTGEQRGRKRGPKTLTAEQMRELGYDRMPSLPKIRYVHRVAA
jgi:hypothetical protein